MEITLEEAANILDGAFNDEDLLAICEKMCSEVATLSREECRSIILSRDTVFLTNNSGMRIEISKEVHRQKITYENLLANHVYSIGTVVQWLSKSKDVGRERDIMLENLISTMTQSEPSARPNVETVSQVCSLRLSQMQITANDVIWMLYDDVISKPQLAVVVANRRENSFNSPTRIKPRTKSPYQLVSIKDHEGELRDGSLIDETEEDDEGGVNVQTTVTRHDDLHDVADDTTSSPDILDETDIDSNPPTDGTWDYDHMEVSLTEEKAATLEDKEVENITDSKDHLTTATAFFLSDNTSDSDVSPRSQKKEEVLEAEGDREESPPIKKPQKAKPRDLWRKAGLNVQTKLYNKGWMGVINKAQSQGQLKPAIFNMKITKAISKMAKCQADKENHPHNGKPTLNLESKASVEPNQDPTTNSEKKAETPTTKKSLTKSNIKEPARKEQKQNVENKPIGLPAKGLPKTSIPKPNEDEVVMKPERQRSGSLSYSKPSGLPKIRRQSIQGSCSAQKQTPSKEIKGAKITKPVVPKITKTNPNKKDEVMKPEKKKETFLNPNRRSSVPSVVISPPTPDLKMLKRQSSANAIIKSNMKAKMEKEKQGKNNASSAVKGNPKSSNMKFKNVTSRIDTNLSSISRNVKNALKSVATPEKNSISTKRRGSLPVVKPPALQTPSIRRRSLPGTSPAPTKRGSMKPASKKITGPTATGNGATAKLKTDSKDPGKPVKSQQSSGNLKNTANKETPEADKNTCRPRIKNKTSATVKSAPNAPKAGSKQAPEKHSSSDPEKCSSSYPEKCSSSYPEKHGSSDPEKRSSSDPEKRTSSNPEKSSSSDPEKISSDVTKANYSRDEGSAGEQRNLKDLEKIEAEVTKSHITVVSEKMISNNGMKQNSDSLEKYISNIPEKLILNVPKNLNSNVPQKDHLHGSENESSYAPRQCINKVPVKPYTNPPEKLSSLDATLSNSSYVTEEQSINPKSNVPDNHNSSGAYEKATKPEYKRNPNIIGRHVEEDLKSVVPEVHRGNITDNHDPNIPEQESCYISTNNKPHTPEKITTNVLEKYSPFTVLDKHAPEISSSFVQENQRPNCLESKNPTRPDIKTADIPEKDLSYISKGYFPEKDNSGDAKSYRTPLSHTRANGKSIVSEKHAPENLESNVEIPGKVGSNIPNENIVSVQENAVAQHYCSLKTGESLELDDEENVLDDPQDALNVKRDSLTREKATHLDTLPEFSRDIGNLVEQLDKDLVHQDKHIGQNQQQAAKPENTTDKTKDVGKIPEIKEEPAIDNEAKPHLRQLNTVAIKYEEPIPLDDDTADTCRDGSHSKPAEGHVREEKAEVGNHITEVTESSSMEHVIDDDLDAIMVPDFTMSSEIINGDYPDEITWQDPIHNSALNILDGNEDQIVAATYLETITEVSNECSETSRGLSTSMDTTFNTSRDVSSILLDDTKEISSILLDETIDEDELPAVGVLETGKRSPSSKWKIVRANLKSKKLRMNKIEGQEDSVSREKVNSPKTVKTKSINSPAEELTEMFGFKPIQDTSQEDLHTTNTSLIGVPNSSSIEEASCYPNLSLKNDVKTDSRLSPVAIMREVVRPLAFSTQCVSLEEIMRVIDKSLNENELWLLLMCTIKALRLTKSVKLSPSVIYIDDRGSISFKGNNGTLSEMEVVEEKEAVFSLGACIWYCGDYNMGEDEEPILSNVIQNLLIRMTDSNESIRPNYNQLEEAYRLHMGVHVKSLKSLFSTYKNILRAQNESHALSRYTPISTPSQPSIQIIINKDDVQKSRSQLQPTITINDKSLMNASFQNRNLNSSFQARNLVGNNSFQDDSLTSSFTPRPPEIPRPSNVTRNPALYKAPCHDKKISKSEQFFDLNHGMEQLKCQINNFFPEVPSHRSGASPVATSSPTKDRYTDSISEISLSPIKDDTFLIAEHLNNDMNRPVEHQLSGDVQLDNSLRRRSIVSTLAQLKQSGRVPEDNPVVDEIVEIMSLDVDVSGLLDFLENRIEINMDKIDSGDTIVNALAGVENNIEFKLLQVEALKKAMRRDNMPGIVVPQPDTDLQNPHVERRRCSSSEDKLINDLSSKIISELRDISRSPIPRKEQFETPIEPETRLPTVTHTVLDSHKNKLSIPKNQLLSFFASNLPEKSRGDAAADFEPLNVTVEDSHVSILAPKKFPAVPEDHIRNILSTLEDPDEYQDNGNEVGAVEKSINIGEDESSSSESSLSFKKIDISSAYGRTSPDGAQSPKSDFQYPEFNIGEINGVVDCNTDAPPPSRYDQIAQQPNKRNMTIEKKNCYGQINYF